MNLRAHFIKNQLYYILFLCCLISRIITSIYYIEDIDSLRFAYSILEEFNILKLQPHFPGYAVFCFLGNILYYITGNIGLVFSIIGALSTFFIIYFSIKILDYQIDSSDSYFLISLIFFNPLLWIMSNRYMPDLMGLALFCAIFYFLFQKTNKSIIFGGLLLGLFLGVRLSYFPLILLPFILIIIKNQYRFIFFSSIVFGVLIWLTPMIWITGFDGLISQAWKHTLGHFTEYGGTVLTENNVITRLSYLFQTIWADGFGGFWIGRSFYTLLLSIIILPLLYKTLINIREICNYNVKTRNMLICAFIYLIWILLFQNVIYKSRHILPLVLVIIFLLSISFKLYFINDKSTKYYYSIILVFLLGLISIKLNLNHRNPTSIAQLSSYLKNKNESLSIISIPLINYYLKSQAINAKYIDIENINERINIDANIVNTNVYIVGDFFKLIDNKFIIESDTSFFHNPYINRMWSTINIFSLK